MTTAAERFASWAAGLRLDDIPPEARRAAARHLLDGLGVALVASRTRAVPFASSVARSLGGSDEAHILNEPGPIGAPSAAFANGVLVHALDFDDTHTPSLTHPTSVVLPAAFAVGEASSASGAAVLTAAVAGYEVVTRLGAVVRHGFHARGFHATSVCGTVAASVVAAKITGLDAAGIANAIGIAGSMASGSLEFLHTGSSTKQLHPGWASHAGVVATRLAAAGATGPSSILEGEFGLLRSFTGSERTSDEVTDGLGERWEVTRIGMKPYPACQLFHRSIDALASVRDGLDGTAIERITFEVPREAEPIVCTPEADKRRPRTPYEAKFSLQWSAAAFLVDGRLGVDTYVPAALDRPDVLSLADRVAWTVVDPDGAPGDAPGRVSITLTGGSTVAGEAPGGSQPSTDEAVGTKLRSHGLPAADALAEAVLSIEDAEGLNDVLAHTSPALEEVR